MRVFLQFPCMAARAINPNRKKKTMEFWEERFIRQLISLLSVIVRVSKVLKKTVVVDND